MNRQEKISAQITVAQKFMLPCPHCGKSKFSQKETAKFMRVHPSTLTRWLQKERSKKL